VFSKLTSAGERQFVADKDKWPMEPGLTTDLGKARHWNHPPGVRRWVKRHIAAFPELAECKREMVNEDLVEAAQTASLAALDKAPNKPAKARPAKRPKSKTAEVKKVSRKVATPRPRKRAKVAKAA
jgi:hypothetical protein